MRSPKLWENGVVILEETHERHLEEVIFNNRDVVLDGLFCIITIIIT